MPAVADDEPLPIERLAAYQRGARAWVSVGEDDVPLGYALALVVDGLGHLEQLSVRPTASRQGRGRALVEEVVAWARGWGAPAVTLSTFREVPWNAPSYARQGFRPLGDAELTPGLRALRTAEEAAGLDVAARTFMRLDL
jgi:GNAT superfamily N-acetyltransferase